MPKNKCVLQDWVLELPLMQQSVLITATRGPDGIKKDHVAKSLIRWLRRCYLKFAFEGTVIWHPMKVGGGSFTGPSLAPHINPTTMALDDEAEWGTAMTSLVFEYLRYTDELPHHFQLHFMHAAEVLGYKHPDLKIRVWWQMTYLTLANDMHLEPESSHAMNKRLGDSEEDWRKAEEITAKPPE